MFGRRDVGLVNHHIRRLQRLRHVPAFEIQRIAHKIFGLEPGSLRVFERHRKLRTARSRC